MAVFTRKGLVFSLAAVLTAVTASATAAPATGSPLPRVLPDGGRYSDVDLSAYGLPEAFTATPVWRLQPPLQPARRLAYRGWLAASEQRESAARINFDRALRITPNDRHLWWAYGWGQLNLGHPARALAAFQRNLALRPEQRPLWWPMAMALTYTAAGDHALARAWYRSAAISDPSHWGSDSLARRSTQEWTSRERALLHELLAHDAAAGSPVSVTPRKGLAP